MKETAARNKPRDANRRHGKVRVAVPSQTPVGSPPPARDPEDDLPDGGESRSGGDEVGRPAENMQELRHQLKYARVGTGDIAAAFYACTFKVGAKGFTMLIVTCRRSGRWKKALEIFETMRGGGVWGVKPNFYTYSALISVCCNAGACNKAIDIVRDMIYAASSGTDPGIEPDVGIFRVVMTACSRHERHKSVLELHRVMTQGNIPQDEAITTCVLQAFLALSNCRGALDSVHELWAMGAQVDEGLCVGLLGTAAVHEGLQFVVEAFLTLQMGGVEISPELCHPVMVAVRAAGHTEMGMQLLEEMHVAEVAVREETYNELLWTLATNGKCEEALKVGGPSNVSKDFPSLPLSLFSCCWFCLLALLDLGREKLERKDLLSFSPSSAGDRPRIIQGFVGFGV